MTWLVRSILTHSFLLRPPGVSVADGGVQTFRVELETILSQSANTLGQAWGDVFGATWGGASSTSSGFFLLLETGDYLLLE